MSEPLYTMQPGDPGWWATLAEEAESLATAIWQDDEERRTRKLNELRVALEKLDNPQQVNTALRFREEEEG